MYNVLVATCVAEEGLDIGDVDLIICYDSSSSPIQMVHIHVFPSNMCSYKEWVVRDENDKAKSFSS